MLFLIIECRPSMRNFAHGRLRTNCRGCAPPSKPLSLTFTLVRSAWCLPGQKLQKELLHLPDTSHPLPSPYHHTCSRSDHQTPLHVAMHIVYPRAAHTDRHVRPDASFVDVYRTHTWKFVRGETCAEQSSWMLAPSVLIRASMMVMGGVGLLEVWFNANINSTYV